MGEGGAGAPSKPPYHSISHVTMVLTGNWHSLGDVFFRKEEFYQLEWASQIDLNKFIVAAAPYGGPLALIPNDSENPKAISSNPKLMIYLFTSAGNLLKEIRWTSGRVIQIGWSNSEDLLCVQDDGTVLVYDIFGNFKRTFSMGQDAKEVKVMEAQIFPSYSGTGIAIMTTTRRIYIVNSVEDPRIRRLAEIPGCDKGEVTCWTLLHRDRHTRALVAVAGTPELYLVDHGGQCAPLKPGIAGLFTEYTAMVLSADNARLALFTDTGLLWMGSSDCERIDCEFDAKTPQKPDQLVWCANDAVVCQWERMLLVVGLGKDWIKFPLDGPSHLVAEVDGVRIVGSYTLDFLQRVPAVTEDIFKIASMSEGAMLYEAYKEFKRESQRADEFVRMIKDRLELAVEDCIEAAGHEWDSTEQKSLLRAASFGKCFLSDYKPERFVSMCQWLRVLNAVRDPKIGMPLTYAQLQKLSVGVLIDRLVLRREYFLAIRMCQYLRLPESEGASRVLAHWACYKVQQTSQSDEAIARVIANKLGDSPGVSYSEIASKAVECGRKDLATRLLDYEAKAAEQVPLLMKMGKEILALNKSIESGDTDLVYTVLLQIKASLPQGEFFMAIRNIPMAHALFFQYCRQYNPTMLRDLYYQEDNFHEEANCRVRECYDEESIDSRLKHLHHAHEAFSKARNDWAAKQTEEQLRLLKYQRRLEEEKNRPYLDLSVHQTIHRLLLENEHKHAEQIRKDFKIPERRYWWLKIRALSEAGDWLELDKFSRSKRSPIGYEPFVEVCLEKDNPNEAAKYLPRVTPEKKVKYYMKAGKLEEAGELAIQNKNLEEINSVLAKGSSNQLLASKLEAMKATLSK